MATTPASASTASAPAPSAPPASKTGFDLLRPVRYASSFIGGTVQSGLNGTATWGRKGMYLGVATGTLVMLSGAAVMGVAGPALLLVGAVFGLVGGAVTGGTIGLVTGGIRGIDRENRRDKYSEDLLAKANARRKPQPKVDYRAAHREHKQGESYNIDRVFQQDRENDRDTSTYFQDMVHASRSGGQERGF